MTEIYIARESNEAGSFTFYELSLHNFGNMNLLRQTVLRSFFFNLEVIETHLSIDRARKLFFKIIDFLSSRHSSVNIFF